MAEEWELDKNWASRFIAQIKGIVGKCLIREAPYEDDALRNTDLMVLTFPDGIRIGCRVRRPKLYNGDDTFQKYRNEFTIRSSRGSGAKTELEKIIEGWGHYFFYGISDPEEKSLRSYILGDLKIFRSWFINKVTTCPGNAGVEKANRDGTTRFKAFRIDEMPTGFLLARYPKPEPVQPKPASFSKPVPEPTFFP